MKKFLSIAICALMLASCVMMSACGNTTPQNNTPVEGETLQSTISRDQLLTPLSNDYRSRTAVSYAGINGKTVDVYTFYREAGEVGNNPNFSQILMVYQCIKYKDAHPEENVSITLTSFHFSVVVAGCVVPDSPNYGDMKNLYDVEYTADGYYRLSYLLVEAARKGIEVTVIAQLDASATETAAGLWQEDLSFDAYFTSHLSDNAYITGKKVSDYMTFAKSNWTSYGDKAAADMMHNKTCTVSHYIDNAGNEHGAAFWTGSINVDGVNYLGQNGHDSIQTSVVITGHEELRRVTYNYTKLMANYCGQEDIVPFRVKVASMTTEQIALLESGQAASIPSDAQIVYLGSETDGVFELYFTPFGGSFSTWDTANNPYCKYISKLLASGKNGDYIEFLWHNVKYNQNFELADYMMEAVSLAFRESGRKDNILFLHLPGVNTATFTGLTAGENIGVLSINETTRNYHTKDVQLSYVEDGVRYYVTLYNSLNIHEGSMYHQTNTVLVIKESAPVGNDFYTDYATLTIPSIAFEPRRIKAE